MHKFCEKKKRAQAKSKYNSIPTASTALKQPMTSESFVTTVQSFFGIFKTAGHV